MATVEQLLESLGVPLRPLGLEDRPLVPVEVQPAQRVQDLLREAGLDCTVTMMATTMQAAPVNPKNSAAVKRRAMTCGSVGTMPVASIDTTSSFRNSMRSSLFSREAHGLT